MLVLAFDTSSPAVTVALGRDDVRLAERTEIATNRHGELLAPLIMAVLCDRGVAPDGLDAIAVGLGPGPFTGLRVGIMTAKSMGDALAIPVYGECSLDVIAREASGLARDDVAGHQGDFAVLSDARRKQVYWATYSSAGDRLSGPQLSPPADLSAELDGQYVVGAGAALYPDVFDGSMRHGEVLYPSAATLAEMTFPKLIRRSPGDDLTPLYLRRPDAVPPGAPKQVTPA